MRRVKIVIRYYDEQGEVVCEDEPNLRHHYRVPLHWTRWEIYWDEELVQSGTRVEPAAEAAERRTATGSRGRAAETGGRRAEPAAEPGDDETLLAPWLVLQPS